MSSPRLPTNNDTTTTTAPRRTKPSSPGQTSMATVLRRIALVGLLVVAAWWIYAWKNNLVQDFFDPKDPVHLSRPGFRYVEPYSSKHKYRPAASPIIKEKLRNGQVKHKGQYW